MRSRTKADFIGSRISVTHWALVPLLTGVLLGIALSTVVIVRPYAESITTNIYLQLPAQAAGPSERLVELRQMLADLQASKRSGDVEKLSEEVKVKAPVYYAVVMSERHSAVQLQMLRRTWTEDISRESIEFFIPMESVKEEKEEAVEERDAVKSEEIAEEEWEDVHYGEITLTKSDADSISLVELHQTHTDFYLDAVSFICKNRLKSSKWFFLAGDDVYVRHTALQTFLRKYEGMGDADYLGHPDPSGVCTPGPGYILSYFVLEKLCSKLEACAKKREGGNEQEEEGEEKKEGLGRRGEVVGSCITEELGVRCSKYVEGEQHFLILDPAQLTKLTEDTDQALWDRALTIFPVSGPRELYSLHQAVVKRELNATQHQLQELKWAMDRMTEFLPQTHPKLGVGLRQWVDVVTVDDIVSWQLVNHDSLMSDEESVPTRDVPGSWRVELELLLEKAVQYLNAQSDNEHKYQRTLNAYWRVDPTVGIHYIVEFETTIADSDRLASQPIRHRGTFTRPLNSPEVSPPLASLPVYITIGVCLTSDHSNQLQQFMTRLEPILDHDQKIHLIVVHMKSTSEKQKPKRATTNVLDPKSILSLYKHQYPQATFTVLESTAFLSRSYAIALLLQESRPSELLLLADLELEFDNKFLERCRNIPVQGQQVYFPIPFSQTSPSMLASFNHSLLEGSISQHSGYWLVNSYSIACIYAADLLAISTQVDKKGISQDVDLMEAYQSLLKKRYEIIRAPEKRLKRVFSDRKCEANMIGENNEPCSAGGGQGGSYETEYIKTQLSVLLFDHEGENSKIKY